MVIFHSYVSLPEGILYASAPGIENMTLSCHEYFSRVPIPSFLLQKPDGVTLSFLILFHIFHPPKKC